MKSSSDAPTFNLKAVVQETGLKPDTLRAWERRYGLPVPQRTDSGHRLYSQKDLQLLKWLIARQEEGMSISRAVELWRRLEAEASDPLQTIPIPNPLSHNPASHPLPQSVTPPATPYRVGQVTSPSPSAATGDMLTQACEAWVAACLNFDEQQAERIISQAFGLFSVERICIDIFQKGLAIIGEGWYSGRVTVQQEHFASALAGRRLEALIAATPPPTRPGRVLIGCPPEEVHILPPLMLSLLLRRRGWDVLFLGANIPAQDFILTTRKARPNLVILIAQQLYTAASLREMGELIYQERVPMAFGGLIFNQLPELQSRITGHYLGISIEGAVQRIEDLLFSARLPQVTQPLTMDYAEALEHFRVQQASIEAELWRNMAVTSMPHTMLHKANNNFGRTIIAALTLGNIEYLGADLHWIQGLLTNHYQMPATMVIHYMAAYRIAAQSQLKGHGKVLIDWLNRILMQEGYPAVVASANEAPTKE